MTDQPTLVDLAAEALGGTAVAASDEFFAAKERLVLEAAPEHREHEYTDRGKWMDGWESRRRRGEGFDWCVIRLGARGIVRHVVVDTAHFKGNYPQACSLDVTEWASHPEVTHLVAVAGDWTAVLDRTPLGGDAPHRFDVRPAPPATHVRLNIFPDGGVARLRVYGEVTPDWPALIALNGRLDFASAALGGRIVAASDEFFGSPHRLLLPRPPRDMRDGWETRRRRGEGHDWVVVRLAVPATLQYVEVDTTHFKGNAPGRCTLEVSTRAAVSPADPDAADWQDCLPPTPLAPDRCHLFPAAHPTRGVTHARFSTFPDGGVARLRLFGSIDEAAIAGLTRR